MSTDTIIKQFARIGINVDGIEDGKASSTLPQYGKAVGEPTLKATVVALDPAKNRVVWSFDQAALDALAGQSVTRRTGGTVSIKTKTVYTVECQNTTNSVTEFVWYGVSGHMTINGKPYAVTTKPAKDVYSITRNQGESAQAYDKRANRPVPVLNIDGLEVASYGLKNLVVKAANADAGLDDDNENLD